MYESSRPFYRQRCNWNGVVFPKKKELHIRDESLLHFRQGTAVLKNTGSLSIDREYNIFTTIYLLSSCSDYLQCVTRTFFSIFSLFQGYSPEIFYPKRPDKPLFKNLTKQCERMEIPFVEISRDNDLGQTFGLIVDAFFGFSFKPPIRSTFEEPISLLKSTKVPICSIDVPSGE